MQVLLLLLILAALFAYYVSTRSGDFRVSRQGFVATPPERVFPHVNNLHKWQEWSPWARLDPQAKTDFEGPEEGVGAVMRWQGNAKVGTGSMTIVESVPGVRVAFRLDFLKPMPGTNTAEFIFAPEAGGTRVTWNMSGRNESFLAKAMGVIFNCEKMVGSHFESGLANLKAVAESAAVS